MASTKTRPAPTTNVVDSGSIVIASLHGRYGSKVRPVIVVEPLGGDEGWAALAITTQRYAANGSERPAVLDQFACGLQRPVWLWSHHAWPILPGDVRRVGRTVTPAVARQVADHLADREQAARFLDRYAWRIAA